MAYQARQRDPLFDSDTQAIIERRGKELIGLTLLGLAFLVALALGSYSPDDPNWLSSTEEPAQNLLGPLGAAFASPLYVIAGYGAWAIAAVFAVWGARFVVHHGEEHAIGRLIFAPIAVAMVSVYFSTHVPGEGWDHSFGSGRSLRRHGPWRDPGRPSRFPRCGAQGRSGRAFCRKHRNDGLRARLRPQGTLDLYTLSHRWPDPDLSRHPLASGTRRHRRAASRKICPRPGTRRAR